MNDLTVLQPPSGADLGKALNEIRDFDSLLADNPSQALLEYLEKAGATLEERNDIKRSFNQVGFKLAQIETPLLQVMWARLILEQLRKDAFKEGLEQNERVLTAGRNAQTLVIENFRKAMIESLKEALLQSYHLHGEITDNLSSLNELMKELTTDGQVADRFSTLLINKMSDGIEQQVLTVQSSLDAVINNQTNNIKAVHSALNGIVVAQASEVKKLQDIKVRDLATPITECVQAEITANAEEVKAKFVEVGDHAVSAVRKSCGQAVKDMGEAKQSMLAVVESAKKKIQERFWIEQTKTWAGCFVMFIAAQWFVNLSWTYRLFH